MNSNVAYSVTGKISQYVIMPHLLHCTHTIILEFIVSIIFLWQDIIHTNILPILYLLSIGDSSTSSSWLQKSNFKEIEEDGTNSTAKFVTTRRYHTKIDIIYVLSMTPCWQQQRVRFSFALYPLIKHIAHQSTHLVHHLSYTLNYRISPLNPSITLWVYSSLGNVHL